MPGKKPPDVAGPSMQELPGGYPGLHDADGAPHQHLHQEALGAWGDCLVRPVYQALSKGGALSISQGHRLAGLALTGAMGGRPLGLSVGACLSARGGPVGVRRVLAGGNGNPGCPFLHVYQCNLCVTLTALLAECTLASARHAYYCANAALDNRQEGSQVGKKRR